jgi:hypothetical protein
MDATLKRPEKQVRKKKTSYGARPIKRIRRSKTAISDIQQAITELLAADNPMTVRQLYYQLVSRKAIEKTEAEYKTICRLLTNMRRDGEIPFAWLADNTRWMRKPRTYSSLEGALQNTARTYRRALWDTQDCYVEVWLEKDALSGVLIDVTAEWDVPLMVTRGYPSLTFLHSAAQEIAEQNRPCFLYYLGDHDPSGVDIPKKVERDLRIFAPDAEIYFERIAVNPDQIELYNLPTRPTKKSDTRSRSFDGESVEVDAIPPDTLRHIVRREIELHIDVRELNQLRTIEAAERETLESMIANMEGE